MDTCWIFAHPDDEAFGPGLVMAALRRCGHRAHLLTLTRGGATRLRRHLGLERAAMEALREKELHAACAVLGCASVQVADFPDGGLLHTDRRRLCARVLAFLRTHRPALVVGFPHHGINGHPDHCVSASVTAQAWWDYQDEQPCRLASLQLAERAAADWTHGTHGIDPASADVRMQLDEEHLELGARALACHASQAAVIREHQPLERLGGGLLFQTTAERHAPPLRDLLDGLPATG
ncbi:MAG: PIG-L deacetylase family protein [Planctomycetota bacterium]